jgi:hypothetical protein
MPPKNEHPDARPLSTAPGETPKAKSDKTSATGSAKKASARTRTPSKSAATEAPETSVPRTRRKATNATSVEPPAVKATPRARRSPKTTGVSTASAAADGVGEGLDARPVSDAQHATRDVEAEVRVRAYLLSLARGDRPGSPDSDWYQAEREIALIHQS